MIEYIAWGISIGMLSMIVIDSLFDSWTSYRKDLRLSRCKCKECEE